MDYVGDIVAGTPLPFPFDTADAINQPVTLGGTPAARVYRHGSLSESAAGVSVAVDLDGRVGFHVVTVDTAADGTFYAAGNDFFVVLTSGDVNGVTVAPKYLGAFSIANRSSVSAPSAEDNADALLDRADGIEVGVTLREAFRLSLAALAGKISGAGTTTVTIKNAVADDKNRITATVTADGNRTAITYDTT